MSEFKFIFSDFKHALSKSPKMFQKILFLLLLVGVPSTVGRALIKVDHAIYIGVVKIAHQNSEAQAVIDVKVFMDDLQNVLQNAYGFEKIAGTDAFCTQNKTFIHQYFSEHFQCKINDKKAEMTLKNCEAQNDIYWLTFEMPCPENWSAITLKADFFMELFPDQSNVLSVYEGNERRFGRATKGQEVLIFDFYKNLDE